MTRPILIALLCSAALPALAQTEAAPSSEAGSQPPPNGPGTAPDAVQTGTEGFDRRVITTGLEGPWEVTLGPDGMLWVTERTGKRVTRIDPATGEAQSAVTIDEVEAPGGQDGLLGMALHPELGQGTGNDYVFLAYTYLDPDRPADPTVAEADSPYRHLFAKIVRYTWSPEAADLTDPTEVIAGLPASNDHNSGRLKIGPNGKLYYTIGDQGNNQLGNWCSPIESQRLPTREEVEAQDWSAYAGKSLRLDMDGSVPADNPQFDGVRSHVFTYGHRNMQGIAFSPTGHLFASEQGPKTDDEINLLTAGGNYGWPHVAGYVDDRAYVYARWAESAPTPCEELTFSDIEIPEGIPTEAETDWDEPQNHTDPLATLFTVPDDWNFQDPACGGVDFICWPTVAASSIEVYAPGIPAIPGWSDSLIIPTLKRGSLYRLQLSDDGTSVTGPVYRYFQSENRFRDTAVSEDGLTIYVATDPGGLAESAAGGTTTEMADPGAILAFTYNPDAGPPAPTPQAETDDAQAEAPAGTATEDQPTGQFYPPVFAQAQVDQGRTAFNGNCASCHGNTLTNGTMGPPLGGDYFRNRWDGAAVAELFRISHETMPPSRPGALPDETYAAITAYILSQNGFAAGDETLPPDPDALANMRIVWPEE